MRAFPSYLASIEIWPVGLVIAASMVTARALPIALGVAGIFWFVRWLAYGHVCVRTPADWPIALLILMIPVTLWVSPVPETTRPDVYRLLTGVALFYAIMNWTTSRAHLRFLLACLLMLGVLLALSAPFSVVWRPETALPFIPRSLYLRLPVQLAGANPNVRAAGLAILLPCAVSSLIFAWRQIGRLMRIMTVVAALGMAIVLVLTQSRGGLMAFAAALLVLVALRWRRGWLLLVATAIAAFVAIHIVGVSMFLRSTQANATVGGLDDRLLIWSHALYLITRFPLTGIGMGAFAQVTTAMVPFAVANPELVPIHAHNLLLQIALDLGIPGLVAWLAVFFLVIAVAWQTYRHGYLCGDMWMAALGAGLLGSQVALMIHGVVDAATWGIFRPSVVVWALWGLAMASWQMTRRQGGIPITAPGCDGAAEPSDVRVELPPLRGRSVHEPVPHIFRAR